MISVGRKSVLLALAAFALAGCSSFKESIGATKQAPDETSIVTRSPLVVPATFDLKAPQPGVPRPQDADAAAAAKRVLGGASNRSVPASDGERALLSAAGTEKADPNIRRELRKEVIDSGKRKSYSDAVLFWRGRKVDDGTPLEAGAEAERISTSRPVIRKADPASPVESQPVTGPEEKPEADEDDDSGGWFDWF